jgi:hypothetical protein
LTLIHRERALLPGKTSCQKLFTAILRGKECAESRRACRRAAKIYAAPNVRDHKSRHDQPKSRHFWWLYEGIILSHSHFYCNNIKNLYSLSLLHSSSPRTNGAMRASSSFSKMKNIPWEHIIKYSAPFQRSHTQTHTWRIIHTAYFTFITLIMGNWCKRDWFESIKIKQLPRRAAIRAFIGLCNSP